MPYQTTAEKPGHHLPQTVQDPLSDHDLFMQEVLAGLRQPQKELPCKYLYDDAGSRLFEQICGLDEYYIPRTEAAIMLSCISDFTRIIGPDALIIEYGSGNCEKVCFLLDHLPRPAAYVPIDISGATLLAAANTLAARYPGLEVLPVTADYTNGFQMPVTSSAFGSTVVYFPGSTISNFHPLQAIQFLKSIAATCGPGGGLLIGVDLQKDPAILHRAYNDSQGVTAAFNLNLLERLNRETGAGFDIDNFSHYAFYNPITGRIEMHLVSQRKQAVHLDGREMHFDPGETIWTESSYKYTLHGFERLARAAGFRVKAAWTDRQEWFAVFYLVPSGTGN